jgi:hypothetical protein
MRGSLGSGDTGMSFVRLFSVLVGVLVCVGTAAAADPRPVPRTRRIILNDDGGIHLPKDGTSWDRYLNQRVRLANRTQTDSYFLCVAATSHGPDFLPAVVSTMSHWAAKKAIPSRYDQAARRSIEAARRNGWEVFASIRMNDSHDRVRANAGELSYPLKASRPELLLGNSRSKEIGNKAYPENSVMSWFWAAFNWGEEDVRRHFLEFIQWYCSRYDFDGLELDYYRHPLFFKLGEEEEHMPKMTGFVRQVRQTLDEIGKRRGRPYLLAIRIPDTPEICRRSGLDAPVWLRENLMDLVVVGGGYMPYSGRLKQFIDLAHRYNIPAYPCINHFRGPVQMRSLASNFHALGGDGVYLFNFTRPTGKAILPEWGISDMISLSEIGSPKTLLSKEKAFLADTGEHRNYIGHSNLESQFPVRILGGRPVDLFVGDNIPSASKEGTLKELRLEIDVANVEPQTRISITINGVAVGAGRITRTGDTKIVARLLTSSVRRGINQVRCAPGKEAPGKLDSQVTGMRLIVLYK